MKKVVILAEKLLNKNAYTIINFFAEKMKTFINIILFFLLGITFLSCSDDELGFSDAQKEIVGRWELVEAGDLLPPVGTFMRYDVYNNDGTYNTYYKDADGQELVESGNSYVLKKAENDVWTYSDGIIVHFNYFLCTTSVLTGNSEEYGCIIKDNTMKLYMLGYVRTYTGEVFLNRPAIYKRQSH